MKIFVLSIVFLIFNINYTFSFLEETSFYGYGQIDYTYNQKSDLKATFDVTRLNLIGEFNLSPESRFISDIEFENNAFLGPSGNIGNIKFSQIWVEYAFLPELKVRAGKILTNFGLYNKIHDASPTYFSVSPPIMYNRQTPTNNYTAKQRYFGKYLFGAELTGTIDLGNAGTQLEYSLMFGNGRNDYVEKTYVGNNTSLSARVLLRPEFLSGFHIGASLYTDENQIGLGGVNNSREITYGLEAQYEYDAFQIQSEAYIGSFEDKSLEKINSLLSYIQFAYTIGDAFTPYLQVNYLDLNPKENNELMVGLLGVNYSISTKLYIKLEAQYNYLRYNNKLSEFSSFKSGLSVAF